MEFGRLDHTVRRRGAQIGGLYAALRHMGARLHNLDDPHIVDVPLGAQIAQGPALAQHLEALAAQVEAMQPDGGGADVDAEPVELQDPPRDFGCNVCFENYDNAARLPLFLPCGHVICLHCVRRLARMECPSCRERISSVNRIFW